MLPLDSHKELFKGTDLKHWKNADMETQIGDNGEIPLVSVNDGSGDAKENHEIKTTRERRRSRIMSGVFMGSGTGEEGQEYRKVGTKTLSCTLIH